MINLYEHYTISVCWLAGLAVGWTLFDERTLDPCTTLFQTKVYVVVPAAAQNKGQFEQTIYPRAPVNAMRCDAIREYNTRVQFVGKHC